jgi:hypothetical protein
MYEMQNRERQRALDLIVEEKAAERRPEYPDGNLPDLEDPRPGGAAQDAPPAQRYHAATDR